MDHKVALLFSSVVLAAAVLELRTHAQIVNAPSEANPFDAYNSWKLALGTNVATDARTFTLLPGFQAALVRSAQPEEGSWVALAFDPQGRLTLARERRGLLRLTFEGWAVANPPRAAQSPSSGAGAVSQSARGLAHSKTLREEGAPGKTEGFGVRQSSGAFIQAGDILHSTAVPGQDLVRVSKVEVINDTLLECRGLLYAHDSLYANANNSKALYRLREEDSAGRFTNVTALLRTDGGVGHGRNHLKLGPDGFLYIAHGNNVLPPPSLSPASPLQHYAEDQLIPCPWDRSMFDGDVLVPAGHILRVDRDGRDVRLIAGGFRNPLDVAFNSDGEMFTFDADMEWDVGAPWYMPNRVLHVVSGADFGFRRGSGRFPAYYPDSLPSTLDIGLASPTAVLFGTGSHFPAKYQRALLICDWAYGRILAVHLQPQGASYTAQSEVFISARPLNVTDGAIGPDGALWFITGGRGTQSGLYRVTYNGPRVREPKSDLDKKAAALRRQRRQLEQFHEPRLGPDKAVPSIWPRLGHSDPWIRHAARVALELQPVSLWQNKALRETRRERALTAWLALARVGDKTLASPLLEHLHTLDFAKLTTTQKLMMLRVYALTFIRLGPVDAAIKAACRRRLEALYPAERPNVNHELCELLVYLESPTVIAKTLPLLAAATNSEDLLQYTFFLRYLREGWTAEARRTCFQALARAERMPGARQYFKMVQDTRQEMLAALTPVERDALASVLAESSRSAVTNVPAARPVKDWQMADLVPLLDKAAQGRSFAQGRAALITAQCVQCHRVSADTAMPAGVTGPDLTAVASRFNRRDLLEQILDPSKVIDEKFRQTIFLLQDGSELTGTIERESDDTVVVRSNPLSEQKTELRKAHLRRRDVSAVSPMPAGLLNVLTAEQVLDLLAFLEAGGERSNRAFQP